MLKWWMLYIFLSGLVSVDLLLVAIVAPAPERQLSPACSPVGDKATAEP